MATNKEILESVAKLGEALKAVSDKLEAHITAPVEQPKASVVAAPSGDKYPIPQEYRRTVDEVLNPHFGINLEPLSDSPAFQFTIVVPDKYSSMTPAYREMYKMDIRPKVITYADGKNGVKEWCEKVYSSFSAETKAQIVADRSN